MRVFMYTKGTGSGHLTRINAVYKGFARAGIGVDFHVCAFRSKYRHLLPADVTLHELGDYPHDIDAFVCDWRADPLIDSLPRSLARVWVGLRRLGRMPVTFPQHYHVVAMEPGVKGDICIWPIISTWPDELKDRRQLEELVGVPERTPLCLKCENGAYPKHVATIFGHSCPPGAQSVKCSNNSAAEGHRDVDYHPIAEFFAATDYLVIGGGYNSVHEALSLANLAHTTIVNVGGDDQALRIRKLPEWERGRPSQADVLARHIAALVAVSHRDGV